MLISEGSRVCCLLLLSYKLAFRVVSKEVVVVDCVSIVHATGCLCCPLAVIDVASSEDVSLYLFLGAP